MFEERSFHAFDSFSRKYSRRGRSILVAFDRRAMGSRRIDPIVRAAAAAVDDLSFEHLEHRQLMAAHIVGSSTSYSTIQSAVNAAVAGQTITVDPGTYNETVTIYTPNLTIRGANAGVDGRSTRSTESIVYATQTVFDVFANDTTIDGFTIEGNDSDIGALQGAGVLMRPSIHGTHVINNIIQNNVTGIYLSNNSNTDQCLIQHNLIQNNFEANNSWTKVPGENGSRGIYTDGTVSGGYLTNVLIDANTIYNSNYNGGDEDEGIIALQALNAGKQFNITISNNYWGGDSKALLATNVTNLTVIGNNVTGTTDASSGALRFEGDANSVNIQYNTITANGGPGVGVDDSGAAGDNSGFVVDDNNIYGNNENIGFITQAAIYDGTVYTQGGWWGSASGPGGDGPGTGSAVWANGTSGHYLTPTGAAGGSIVYSPWATSLINIAAIPVPSAATGLTAAPAAGGQLALAWTPAFSTATGQYLQRSTDGVNFTTVDTLPPLLSSFTDTGLTTGTTYYYRVVPFNGTGSGSASGTAHAVPPAYQPPMPASGVSLVSTTGMTNTLTWNVPAYPYGITQYNVYRNGTLAGTSTTTSFTDIGLAPNTAYTYTVTTTDTTGAVSAASAAVVFVTGTTQIQDGSFEQTPASEEFGQPTGSWTLNSLAALESGASFGLPATPPDGSQYIALAANSSYSSTIGAVSQTFAVNPGGSYTLSFSLAKSTSYAAEPVAVSIDGTVVGTFTPTSTAYATFTTAPFALAAGTHTVSFAGTSTSSAVLVTGLDKVALNPVAVSTTTTPTAAPGQFVDASFEQTPWAYVYDPTTANWTFTGYSALAGNNSNFGVANAPNGTQSAFLQGYNGGTLGAVSQTVNVAAAGQYTVSLAAAQRAGYGVQPIAVLVDGTQVGVITPTSSAWAVYSTPTFTLTPGAHKFTFSATVNTGDCDSFIDTVSLNSVTSNVAPAAPILVRAAAASPTSVALNWAAGGAGATSYSILRSMNGTTWTTIASGLSTTTANYLDSGLTAGTSYTYQVVAISASGATGSTVVSAATLSSAASTTALSSLTPTSATSGYSTVKTNTSVANNTITLHGTTYATGLGTSAVSVISYNLAGKYNVFSSDVGIDAEEYTAAGALASVDFQVIGDGKVLFDSGNLTTSSPTVHIAVPVTGVQTLTLVATNGVAGIAYDHADWAGATLYSNPTVPAAPTALAATALSSTSISLTWTAPSGSVSSYAIDRSTDGVNFTTIASNISGTATSYTDPTTLAAGTNYSYRIRALNAAGTSPNSNIASATTLSNNIVTTNLSALNWTSATAGYGTVQKNLSISGNTLSLRGNKYYTGLGTHAASTITYNLGGNYSNFLSDVGIDDEEVGKGPGYVDFQVIGDGKILFDSGVLTNTSAVVSINVSVAGVQTLQLVATNGIANNIDYDHADWAGARLVSTAAQALVAPTGLTATSNSPTQVSLAWSSAAPNVTGFSVLRSTDGVHFTTVASNLAATASSYLDTTAAASTKYYYEVVAISGALTSPASNVAQVTTISASAITTNLSTLNWTSATAGYGTVQKNQTISGNTITLRGTTYASGIGTHAASTIVYNLAGKYTNFLSDVGIDDEEIGKGTGSVDFQVIGDGVVLFDSGVLTNASPVVSLNVNVSGVQTLTLVATNGVAGSIDYDHADWAGARLLSTAQTPTAPSNLAAAGIGPSLMNLTWTAPTSANQTSYTISRSTDGVNFTTVATGISAAATSYTDASVLSANTKYYYEIQAVNAAGASSPSTIAAGTTQQLATVTYVSDMTATSSTVGYGTIQKDKSISGNPLTLKGVVYSKGIGTHAASNITYNLAGKFSTFTSDVGIDQEEDGKGSGSVDFQVIGDGKILFDSGVLTNDQVAHINISVAGVQTLQLVATNGIAGSIDYDHADWAGAQLST